MAKTLWLKEGKLVVDADGHPILCDTCPCGTTPSTNKWIKVSVTLGWSNGSLDLKGKVYGTAIANGKYYDLEDPDVISDFIPSGSQDGKTAYAYIYVDSHNTQVNISAEINSGITFRAPSGATAQWTCECNAIYISAKRYTDSIAIGATYSGYGKVTDKGTINGMSPGNTYNFSGSGTASVTVPAYSEPV